MFQTFAYHLVGGQQVGGRDAFAVGRIGDNNALFCRLLKIFKVGFFNSDVVGETCCTHIEACRVNGFDINIVAIDVVLELAFLAFIVVDTVKQILIEIAPALEGELFTEDTRAHVVSDEGCLDK